MKTKSGAKKRFKFLGSGAIKRTHSHLRHILTKKTTKQKKKSSWNRNYFIKRREKSSLDDANTIRSIRCLELNAE